MPRRAKSRKRRVDSSSYNLATEEAEETTLSPLRSFKLRRAETLEYLNGTNMPSKFRFREREIEKIHEFITSCLASTKKGYRFLMITGSPGAGKTLCANTILNAIKVEIIRLNANLIKTISQVQEEICNRLLPDEEFKTALHIIREL